MEGHIITVENQVIHYYKFGSGPKVILAFHGFGLDGKSFAPIAAQLTDSHTIYSFDLFYHGKSHKSNNDQTLSPSNWGKYLKVISEKLAISTFSIMCFSLGGKFALASTYALPEQIEKLIFIAPDGIATSKWYSLATYPLIFRNYFQSMIVKPHRFFFLVRLFKKLGLLDKGLSRFAESQMNTVKKRRRVYYSWVIFKDLAFNMREMADIINSYKIPVSMFLGRYDKIITAKGMEKLLLKLDNYDLEIIESGHNDLIKNVAKHPDLPDYF